MTKSIRITVRLCAVSYGALLVLQRQAGGSRAEAFRRALRKREMAPRGNILPLTKSASFRVSARERAELNVLAHFHNLEPAETIRRLLRAYAQKDQT